VLSVILITKNEEKKIKQCLDSVRFADEVIVLDSGSQDRTVEICRQYTPHVFVTDWPGFGPQKQRALDKATGDWVLSVDADEVVSDQLRGEILQAIKTADVAGYYLPRLSYVCGQPIRHGGWYPDYILRLFRRKSGQFSNDMVHEKILVNGPTAKLRQPLLHYSYDNLEQLIEKYNQYSSLGAKKIFESQRSQSRGLITAIVRAKIAFFRQYFLKLGFLDGRMGFILAVSSAETAYYKYLKLDLLGRP